MLLPLPPITFAVFPFCFRICQFHSFLYHIFTPDTIPFLRLLLLSCFCRTTTIVSRLFWILSGTTRVSWYQKGKTSLDLLEQEIVNGNGICCAICKFAPHPKQVTMPAPHHFVFYRPDALYAVQPTASKHCSAEPITYFVIPFLMLYLVFCYMLTVYYSLVAPLGTENHQW